VMQAIDDTDI